VVGSVIDESRALKESMRESLADEARGVRDSVMGSVIDESRAVRDSVQVSVSDESRAVKDTVVASVMDESRGIKEEARAVRAATESELADLRLDIGHLNADVEALRSDLVELTRVLRMQGDAADQIAEVLGRALTRLSAEVETLSGALENMGAVREGAAPGPGGTAI